MILITGANGQIGTVLTAELRNRYGRNQVLATDIHEPAQSTELFEQLDVLGSNQLARLIKKYQVTQLYHLAAILSAKGEQHPQRTWDINMTGLFNMLEAAKTHQLRLFFPSSIAVFGTQTPTVDTPQNALLFPETVYGISKAAGEYWCNYYWQRYGVDVRSLRFPGLISYQSMPGGGTTDYAVDIFHHAVREEPYVCYLKPDTRLPMLYMDDAIRGTIELMEAPAEKITIRTSYNLAGVSFTPEELASKIQSHLPNFEIQYRPDFRQTIADSWPDSIEDSPARKDWAWHADYDTNAIVEEMLMHIQQQYQVA